LNGIFKQALRSLERDAREGARKCLMRAMLLLSGWLLGAVGIGFLIVWAFMTLKVALGFGAAALVIGFGLTLLAGAFVALALRQPRPVPVEAPKEPPIPPKSDGSDLSSQIAFIAAFVLARYLERD
jgi:hypothetical protein